MVFSLTPSFVANHFCSSFFVRISLVRVTPREVGLRFWVRVEIPSANRNIFGSGKANQNIFGFERRKEMPQEFSREPASDHRRTLDSATRRISSGQIDMSITYVPLGPSR